MKNNSYFPYDMDKHFPLISKDGKFIVAFRGDNYICAWDTDTGHMLWEKQYYGFGLVTLINQDKYISFCNNDNSVTLLELASGTEVFHQNLGNNIINICPHFITKILKGKICYRWKTVVPTLPTIELWEFKAKQYKNPNCQFNMGSTYREGWHVPKSDLRALKYYQKAAKQGHELAMIALGEMYLAGNGVPQSYTIGKAWIKKAVRYAHPDEPDAVFDPVQDKFVAVKAFLETNMDKENGTSAV